MIKLLVSDLDGTFLMKEAVNGSFVSKENYEAMQKFRSKGGIFVTASGRHHEYSYSLMDELGFKFDMIGTNGATIIHENRLIEHNHSPRQNVRLVVEELIKPEYDGILDVIGVDLSFTYVLGRPNDWVYPIFKDLEKEGTVGGVSERSLMDFLDDRKCPDITHLSVMVKDPATLHEWIDKLREMFDRYFDIYASGSQYIDLMRPGVNKGHGVRSIMKMYGLKAHEVAVVGDNQNDISMFFTTDHSYCMSTATPQVKKYANTIVDSVAEVLEDIMQINEMEQVSFHE